MADDVGGDAGRILVVCTANICRSPLAALHLREVLGDGPFAGAVIESAGVHGIEGAEMCVVARDSLDDPARGESHVAREVTKGLVESVDLVLTMEKEQRGAIARLVPGQQSKVFTLREAVAMVEAVAEDARPMPQTVPQLAARIRELRGIVRPPAPVPIERRGLQRLFRGPAEPLDDGYSVEDGHNVDESAHQATVQEVRELSRRLASALSGRGTAAEETRTGD